VRFTPTPRKEYNVMKKIVLIGDSIRMGYDKYVKDALDSSCEVYYPEENCKFAEYVLRFLYDWKKRGEWPDDIDLVHWNAGLWDVIDMDMEGPLTSIEYYAEAVARITRRIHRIFPTAKIVFATSTAVREEGYLSPNFRRSNTVIEQFNATAIKALEGTETVINDLYALTKDIPAECCSDMTHFNTPEGRALLGNKVISVICKELDIELPDITVKSFTPENYTAENIGR
jgi:hypothetical protein